MKVKTLHINRNWSKPKKLYLNIKSKLKQQRRKWYDKENNSKGVTILIMYPSLEDPNIIQAL
jgi:hypothetical protein